ncbi:N-acetylneuraminate synthase [Treponema socranskii]|uniref:N-acetylneuraminate synthase n=1 Tax=Treponema socranskii TaxID=53419 RepID=UPI003D926329
MSTNHTIIIAEAGVNHNGSIELAKKMVDSAKSFGVDYIKFQTGKPELVTSKFALMADYQKKNIGKDESQLDMIKKIMLKAEDFPVLKKYCDDIGIKFCSTPFDLISIDVLVPLGMDFMKVPSGEITNLPYLRKIAAIKIPVVMSTGMSTLGDIEAALDVLYKGGLSIDDITLLHCNTEYPTPFVDVNLKAMLTLKQCFGTKVGYSDHTKGIEVSIAAVAMGATVIEKHFTLDRTLPGPDHIASLEPKEMQKMVRAIRNIEQSMGNGLKYVTDSERKNMAIARKSIVAACDIKIGDVFTERNLITKRPGNGISPMLWDKIVGTKASRNFKEDELIEV